MRETTKRVAKFVVVGVVISATIITSLPAHKTQAAQITNRSLLLQAGTTDGGSKAGGNVRHLFTFDIPSTTTAIAAIKFEYCTTAADPSATPACTMPAGLSTTAATLTSEIGATGFTLNNTTNGTLLLSKVAPATPTSANVSYQFSNVTNPSASNTTFYTRITTYSDTAATTMVDNGSVAASTANAIELTGIMPESLVFCTGDTIPVNSGVPDCSAASGGNINFSELFSTTLTRTASSLMAASTNADYGYNITVNGTTLTSGSNTIPAVAPLMADVPVAPVRGTSQFGMNLVANTATTSTPIVGADIAPASNAVSNLRGQPTANYSQQDRFKFTSGDTIANSSFGGTPGPTNAQLYTASYMVNVQGSQAPGTYKTTLTYICTPTF